MRNKIKKAEKTAIFTAVILIAAFGASWIATCGIIKLITMCFGLTFKWSISTGIWLIIYIIKRHLRR